MSNLTIGMSIMFFDLALIGFHGVSECSQYSSNASFPVHFSSHWPDHSLWVIELHYCATRET